MNERIQSLYTQVCGKEWAYDFDIDKAEQFARLIVQECINIVDILPNGYKDYRNAVENAFREDCIKTIEKHFGVEQ